MRIQNHESALTLLKLFGDLIKFLDISFALIDEDPGIEIGQYIAENSNASLTEFHLKDCYGKVLDKFQTTFRNVNITDFSTHKTKKFEIGSSTFKFDGIFPNLRRFSVDIANVDDWKIIGDKFTNLTSLAVVISKPAYMVLPDIESLLNNSKNINNLELSYSSLNLLKVASVGLPNLKILKLTEFADDFYAGDQIQFNNVSSLCIVSSVNNAQSPGKLAFSRLQSLSLKLGYNLTDQWIQFTKNPTNKRLEFLEIKSPAFKETQLRNIAKHQPNVKWASLVSERKVSIDEVISFLQESQHLVSLELQTSFLDINERNLLEGSLQHLWHFQYFDGTDVTTRFRLTRFVYIKKNQFHVLCRIFQL